MKVSRQEKAGHRDQIILAAARRFREKGFDGISVAELMKEAGLTHGGFYGHFASKEELLALAFQRAMQETSDRWRSVMDAAPDRALEALVRRYLSCRHREHPEGGCPLAALGTDLARQPQGIKDVVMQEQQKFIDLIATAIPGRTKAARRKQAIAVLARLVGAIVLARSVSDENLAAEILEATATSILDAA